MIKEFWLWPRIAQANPHVRHTVREVKEGEINPPEVRSPWLHEPAIRLIDRTEYDRLRAAADKMAHQLVLLDGQGGLGYDRHERMRQIICDYAKDFPK